MNPTHYHLNVTLSFENCTSFSPANAHASFSSNQHLFDIRVRCKECQTVSPIFIRVGVSPGAREVDYKCLLCQATGTLTVIKAATRIEKNPTVNTITKPILHFVCTGNVEPHIFHFGQTTDYQVTGSWQLQGQNISHTFSGFKLLFPSYHGQVTRYGHTLEATLTFGGYDFRRFENIPDDNEWPW